MTAEATARSVLFVDISDSTRLYAELGDDEGRRVVIGCLDLLMPVIERCGGTVVDRIGDELMCTFLDPVSAGRAAGELHRAVEGASDRFSATLRIRVGFHHGALLIEKDRIFGDTVHIARRVTSQAKSQQTLTTRQTRDLIPPEEHLATRFVDRTHLKGKDEPFELFEIVWDVGAATVMEQKPTLTEAGRKPTPELLLDYDGQEHTVDAAHPTLNIGRDPRADVVVDHARVSRFHACVEYRKGSFIFVDQSTNGSRLIDDTNQLRFVRRDEQRLLGKGTIILGPENSELVFPSLAYRVGWKAPSD